MQINAIATTPVSGKYRFNDPNHYEYDCSPKEALAEFDLTNVTAEDFHKMVKKLTSNDNPDSRELGWDLIVSQMADNPAYGITGQNTFYFQLNGRGINMIDQALAFHKKVLSSGGSTTNHDLKVYQALLRINQK